MSEDRSFRDWSPDYFEHRFRGTWVFLEGEGLYQYGGVTGVDDLEEGEDFGLRLRAAYPGGADLILRKGHFNRIKSPSIGFTTIIDDNGLDSVYVRKCAVRRDWRQGLRSNQLRGKRTNGLEYGMDWVFNNRESLRMFSEHLKGNYPTLDFACQAVQEEFAACAVSRNFALDERMKLHYEDIGVVGSANYDSGRLTLMPEFKFLREQLSKEVPQYANI